MKKTLIIAGAVFLAAMAVGTALGVVLSPAKEDAAAAGVAETGHADGAGERAATEGTVAGDMHTLTPNRLDPHQPSPAEAADAGATAEAVDPMRETTRPDVPDASAEALGMEFDELSRILGTLPPKQAALFLDHLDNRMALSILRSMSVQEAARILAYCGDAKYAWLKENLLDLSENGE